MVYLGLGHFVFPLPPFLEYPHVPSKQAEALPFKGQILDIRNPQVLRLGVRQQPQRPPDDEPLGKQPPHDLGVPLDMLVLAIVDVVAVIALPVQARDLLELGLGRVPGGSPVHKVVAPVCVEVFLKPGPPAPPAQLPRAEFPPSVPLSGEGVPLLLGIHWELLCSPWAQQGGVRVRIRFDVWEEMDVEQRPAVVVEEGLVALDLVLVLFVVGRFDGRRAGVAHVVSLHRTMVWFRWDSIQ